MDKELLMNILLAKMKQQTDPQKKLDLGNVYNHLKFSDSPNMFYWKGLPKHVKKLLTSFGVKIEKSIGQDRCYYYEKHDPNTFPYCHICNSGKLVKVYTISF